MIFFKQPIQHTLHALKTPATEAMFILLQGESNHVSAENEGLIFALSSVVDVVELNQHTTPIYPSVIPVNQPTSCYCSSVVYVSVRQQMVF